MNKSKKLEKMLLVSTITLTALIILDYLPLHDIYRDYVSPSLLNSLNIQPLSGLPEWTKTELEWNAVTVNYILKILLALGNVVLIILLQRPDQKPKTSKSK
ncbi:MAG: hypothetical protein GX577_00535 [Leptolinea sp.]|nr:hypothetical protein [Leptolinea sp.]